MGLGPACFTSASHDVILEHLPWFDEKCIRRQNIDVGTLLLSGRLFSGFVQIAVWLVYL